MTFARTVVLAAAGIVLAQTASAQSEAGATRFTLKVENISKGEALKLSNGGSAPFVSAPVLWVISTNGANPIFAGGKPDAGRGLEQLAETGNPAILAKSLGGSTNIVGVGAYASPTGAMADGPLTPGQQYELEISARPGEKLSLAWMFGQSNDLFYSNDRPIELFTAEGKPAAADMTAQLSLWDAGTEMNEEPGLGPNQGPRQKSPDAGITQREGIAHVRDKYSYPKTADVLRVTVTPVGQATAVRR